MKLYEYLAAGNVVLSSSKFGPEFDPELPIFYSTDGRYSEINLVEIDTRIDWNKVTTYIADSKWSVKYASILRFVAELKNK